MSERDPGGLGPERRFGDLVAELLSTAGITRPGEGTGFGRDALRFQGRIFAMLSRGRLVLKLPARRVAELVAAGEGEPFDAGKGTPMREWLRLSPDSALDWLPLAAEALDFVRGSAAGARRESRARS